MLPALPHRSVGLARFTVKVFNCANLIGGKLIVFLSWGE